MQKLKTSVVKKSLNPEWNEDLTLTISDPKLPINLVSYSFNSKIINMLHIECQMPIPFNGVAVFV